MSSQTKFRAGLVQMRSGREVAANLQAVTDLIREAAGEGADYVQTPENTLIMELARERLFSDEVHDQTAHAIDSLCALAEELDIWLHIGATPQRRDENSMANRSTLIGPDGAIAARYDKIHMFDADLDGGESYRESGTYNSGDQAVVAGLPWGRLGMTICYDIRFPNLYRALAQKGADFISVPSAFTQQTGEVHWHVLLRARAIETGCFIMASGQGGWPGCILAQRPSGATKTAWPTARH